jgi:hypothetical protein
MNLFTEKPNYQDKQIQKIKKCISNKNTTFDKLRKQMITEIKNQ